jgi:hypothetical protein
VPVAGADGLAVGPRWLAWRLAAPDRLEVLDLSDPAGAPHTIATAGASASLSRPSLDGDLLVYAVDGRQSSTIQSVNLATSAHGTLRRDLRGLLSAPAVRAGRLLYVRTSALRQQLLRGAARPRRARRDRVLLSIRSTTRRDSGDEPGYSPQGRLAPDRHSHPRKPAAYSLWTTALTTKAAYVTRLRRNGHTADIVRIGL